MTIGDVAEMRLSDALEVAMRDLECLCLIQAIFDT